MASSADSIVSQLRPGSRLAQPLAWSSLTGVPVAHVKSVDRYAYQPVGTWEYACVRVCVCTSGGQGDSSGGGERHTTGQAVGPGCACGAVRAGVLAGFDGRRRAQVERAAGLTPHIGRGASPRVLSRNDLICSSEMRLPPPASSVVPMYAMLCGKICSRGWRGAQAAQLRVEARSRRPGAQQLPPRRTAVAAAPRAAAAAAPPATPLRSGWISRLD